MKQSALAASILLCITGLTGCGPKDEPYKKVDRSPDEVSISALQNLENGKEFFYRRMLGQTPRFLTTLSGMYPDEVKIVQIKRTEKGLQILQEDADNIGSGHEARFNTENNLIPVLTIPGKYIDYKCSEDSFDKCTNKEEVDSSAAKTWDQKRYFVPDYANVKVIGRDWNDLDGLACTIEQQAPTLVQDPEHHWNGHEIDLESGVINFEIKHNYTVANTACLSSFDYDTDKSSFSTTEYFSIVQRDKLTTPGYKAVPYGQEGSTTYGFFTQEHAFRDDDYDANQDGYQQTYLTRFAPKALKSSVTYYLSNSFWNDNNKPFLAAAKEAEAIINVENEQFDTGLPTIHFAQAGDIRYGDLRHSFLRLFDQPLDNGLLGVANFSNDPKTGEIVSGGFNQFSGNFLGNAVYDYGRLVNDYNTGRLDPDSVKKTLGIRSYPLNPTPVAQVTEYPVTKVSLNTVNQPLNNKLTASVAKQGSSAFAQLMEQTLPAQKEWIKQAQAQTPLNDADLSRMVKGVKTDTTPTQSLVKLQQTLKSFADGNNSQISAQSMLAAYKSKENYLSEHNMLSTTALLGGQHRGLPAGVKGYEINWENRDLWVDGYVGIKLKKLSQLPKALRHTMIQDTAAVGFVGTIIHEFGHSIGLRHNFAASRDAKHLFTDAQLKALDSDLRAKGYDNVQLKTDGTSQMEYAVDMFGMGFGPYDLAAIRFGYKRQIQDDQGHWQSLESQDKAILDEWANNSYNNSNTRTGPVDMWEQQGNTPVGFEYCTDEHTDLAITCNRFDAGFNIDQIAQYYIEHYLDLYQLKNTKGSRDQFGFYNMSNYLYSTILNFNHYNEFFKAKSNLDEELNSRFGIPSLDSFCTNPDTASNPLCEYPKAANRMTKFFMQVLTQPDAAVEITAIDPTGQIDPKVEATISLKSLLGLYHHYEDKISPKNRLKPSQAITQYSDAPGLFDELSLLVLQNDLPEMAQQVQSNNDTLNVKVIGRSLNSQSATVSDPNHTYTADKVVLGVWPDRLAAMQALVMHHNLNESDGSTAKAIIDDPEVHNVFNAILCRMTMGEAAEDSCNQLAGSTTLNWNGIKDINDIYPTYRNNDVVEQQIEGLPGYAYGFASYLGLELQHNGIIGKANFFHTLLMQVVHLSTDTDTNGADNAQAMREFVGIHTSNDNVMPASDMPDKITIGNKPQTYIITEQNILARSLEKRIEEIEAIKNKQGLNDFGQAQLTRAQHALAQLPVLDELQTY